MTVNMWKQMIQKKNCVVFAPKIEPTEVWIHALIRNFGCFISAGTRWIFTLCSLQILDRKNGEIEELKSTYRAKQKELEEMVRKLEKKGERSRDCGVNSGRMFTLASLNTQRKKPRKIQPGNGPRRVDWRCPAARLNLEFNRVISALPGCLISLLRPVFIRNP